MGNREELSHGKDAVLLYFLIDVLLLKLVRNGTEQLLNNACKLVVKNSLCSLKLNSKSAGDLQSLGNDFGLRHAYRFDQELADFLGIPFGNFRRMLWICVSESML